VNNGTSHLSNRVRLVLHGVVYLLPAAGPASSEDRGCSMERSTTEYGRLVKTASPSQVVGWRPPGRGFDPERGRVRFTVTRSCFGDKTKLASLIHADGVYSFFLSFNQV
jgi:hypothetical protein